MNPPKIEVEVANLFNRGVGVDLIQCASQCFARVQNLVTPSPPWGSTTHNILIAVPAAYESGGLDAFYVARPCVFKGGKHPRVSGPTIQFDNVTWQLVSWHYPDNKRWIADQDDLGNHIEHCRGFFLDRKATNAIQ